MKLQKFSFYFLILFFAFGCKSNPEVQTVKMTVDQLYSNTKDLFGNPPDPALFSKEIVNKIENAQTFTKNDLARIKKSENPSDKPFMIEGSLITSLYEGYSKYAIKNIEIKDKIAEVTVEFQFDSTPNQIWTDQIILIKENTWKIDNIRYSPKNTDQKDLKERLLIK